MQVVLYTLSKLSCFTFRYLPGRLGVVVEPGGCRTGSGELQERAKRDIKEKCPFKHSHFLRQYSSFRTDWNILHPISPRLAFLNQPPYPGPNHPPPTSSPVLFVCTFFFFTDPLIVTDPCGENSTYFILSLFLNNFTQFFILSRYLRFRRNFKK